MGQIEADLWIRRGENDVQRWESPVLRIGQIQIISAQMRPEKGLDRNQEAIKQYPLLFEVVVYIVVVVDNGRVSLNHAQLWGISIISENKIILHTTGTSSEVVKEPMVPSPIAIPASLTGGSDWAKICLVIYGYMIIGDERVEILLFYKTSTYNVGSCVTLACDV